MMALYHCGFLVLSFHKLCRKPPKKTVDVCTEEADDESSGPPKEKHKKEAATSSNENDRTCAIADISCSSSESESSEFLLNSS